MLSPSSQNVSKTTVFTPVDMLHTQTTDNLYRFCSFVIQRRVFYFHFYKIKVNSRLATRRIGELTFSCLESASSIRNRRKRFCTKNLKSTSVVNGVSGDDNIIKEFSGYTLVRLVSLTPQMLILCMKREYVNICLSILAYAMAVPGL